MIDISNIYITVTYYFSILHYKHSIAEQNDANNRISIKMQNQKVLYDFYICQLPFDKVNLGKF